MEQTITYNNQLYIVLDKITLGTSQYLFVIDQQNKDLKCLTADTLQEYSIDSSFLTWDLNKITIIDHFMTNITALLNTEDNISLAKIIRSIKKFVFYIEESELKHYIKENYPSTVNETSLANLDLFLSKTIEVKDDNMPIQKPTVKFFIKTNQINNSRPLAFRNILYTIFYQLNINNTVYVFTINEAKTEFKVFLEFTKEGQLGYKLPTIDSTISSPQNQNSNILVNYFTNRLNEELAKTNHFELPYVINSIDKFVFYLKESELKSNLIDTTLPLQNQSIINLFLFLDQTIKITDKIYNEPLPTEKEQTTPTYEPIYEPISAPPVETPVKGKKKSKFNTYTFIMIASVIIAGVGCYFLAKWFFDGAKTEKLNDEIQDKVTIDESDGGEAVNPPAETVEQGTTALNDYWRYMKMSLINVDFNELLQINQDTVGWLQVNGTNINYPIVQSGDNDYYLHHAFDGSYNNAGWIFADYRNDLSNLSKNTVIYGHGRLDTTMFGSLKNILTSSWYNNSDNHVIKLSTPTQNTLWQVFSVYSIDAESYYITTDFPTTNQYEKFLTTLKGRSVFNFSANVDINDKVLTLSTCQDNYDHRVVMHAKLIKIENR